MQAVRDHFIGIGLVLLTGMFFACSGARSNVPDETAEVKEETLPAATVAPAASQRQVVTVSKGGSKTAAGERSGRIKFMYDDIYFSRGSTRLDPAAQKLLDQKALWLLSHPGVKVIIEGHTDYKGSKEYNLALGDRRSGAVKSYLMRKGVARERLVAISYGREKPAVSGRTERDRAKNRRVHFVIEDQ